MAQALAAVPTRTSPKEIAISVREVADPTGRGMAKVWGRKQVQRGLLKARGVGWLRGAATKDCANAVSPSGPEGLETEKPLPQAIPLAPPPSAAKMGGVRV